MKRALLAVALALLLCWLALLRIGLVSNGTTPYGLLPAGEVLCFQVASQLQVVRLLIAANVHKLTLDNPDSRYARLKLPGLHKRERQLEQQQQHCQKGGVAN